MSKSQAKILLAAVFAARGTSFLFSKILMDTMTPMSILAVRFILSFLVLAALFYKKLLKTDKAALKGGVLLGVCYTVCMIFEMFGLRLTDSGVSALIENMAIVLVPIYVAVITKKMPKRKTMFCALLAVAGVGFLSVTQVNHVGGTTGILLIISAALTYGVCILVTAVAAKSADPITVGMLQLGTMGVLSLGIALAAGDFALPQSGNQWGMLLMLVLVCSCFGFTFQPVGQKYVTAEAAAVFTVINPLTASIMGITIAGEGMSAAKFIGYALILCALLIYNRNTENKRS